MSTALYELLHCNYKSSCYHHVVQHAIMLAAKKGKAILVLWRGPKTGPHNRTADMRRVSFYVTKSGRKDLAETKDGFFVEPAGAKGHTW